MINIKKWNTEKCVDIVGKDHKKTKTVVSKKRQKTSAMFLREEENANQVDQSYATIINNVDIETYTDS